MDPNKHEFLLPNLVPSPHARILTRTAPAPLRCDALQLPPHMAARHLPVPPLSFLFSNPQSHRSARQSLHRQQHPHARLQKCTEQNRVELASASVRSHFLRHRADYLRVATHAGSHAFGLHNWNSKSLFLWSVDCCALLLSNTF
ncbi:hypothetical protein E2542_SST23175 [Spatholobus suberectus]|nr:hypothetical protein E2542_SST23175 [Spatholobus suberectus]